ncbi:MAG: roadblock/LC7 domain-containing protein [Candidatus Sericytochromatia bacterium]|nr:roadblock/LC7 domain-containing protein [Candidatus Sericytochromatia bacterium]
MLATDLILQKIQSINGIKNSIIVGRDGLIIDSFFYETVDKDLFSAHVLSIFSQITKQAKRFNPNVPKIIIIETDEIVAFIIEIKISDEGMIIYTEFKVGLDIINTIDILKETFKTFA